MPVAVTVGASTWGWRLEGEQTVEAWMRRRPWQGPGSVLVAQMPRALEGIDEYLGQTAYAADAATSALRLAHLRIERHADLHAVLTTWLNIAVCPRRAFMQALANDLIVRPTLFFVTVAADANTDAVLDAATEIVELTAKMGAGPGPAIVLLHHIGQAPLRGTCRLERGWPSGLAAECLTRPIAEVWRAYLHLRIAWETAGLVDDACACDGLQPVELRIGDDPGLERLLGEFARRQFSRMLPHERRTWKDFGAPPGARLTVFGCEEATGGRLTPFPWLARALLLEGTLRPGKRALRAELVCRPLAEQVVMTCFLVETRLRSKIPDTVVGTPPADALAAFERFRAAASLEAEVYPAEHPAPPTDVWDFASMGAILPLVSSISPNTRRLFDCARRLRNAVVHGHHVGWQALLVAREVAVLTREV